MAKRQAPVAVVTGASRGAGKGIALALGGKGYRVYVTGRTRQEGDAPLPGTVFATAEEIKARGGEGVAVICDHSDDDQTRAVFEQVEEESGRLDVLVNNACIIPDELIRPGGFWEKPLAMQEILNVGMRCHYVASYYAAPLMVRRKSGLIVFGSSFGGRCYMHGPAYGAGKAAVDKMASDMAVELRPYNVAALSLWMGMLITERSKRAVEQAPDQYKDIFASAETPEFSGLLIDALARDPKLMERSGKILIGAELALEYGLQDINGNQPPSHRAFLGAPVQMSPARVQ